jgi:beta-glucanase (GH16 family)
LAASIGAADTALNIPGYRLVWHDEFEASAVDPARWDVNVGVNAWYRRASDGRFVEPHWFNEPFSPWTQASTINDERQYYSPDNVSVSDGILVIRAEQETVTDPIGLYDPAYHRYTSGKLNTADEFQFSFGIVKWRAQLPTGQGMWPALWMLNAPNPWFWDDEVDVMEARGSQPTVTTSAHHFKTGPDNANQYNSGTLDTGRNLQQSFNEYGLEWTSSRIQTSINDQTVFTDTVAIPQGPMFLIMNAAVGGHFDGVPSSDAIFPAFFRIDWVRVWQPASHTGDLASGGFETFQGSQWADWNTVDSGNLRSVTSVPLHGNASVEIDWRQPVLNPVPDVSNLLTDGTAGPWSAWLNQLDAAQSVTSSSSTSLATIPASASGESLTLSIHQSAPSHSANSVVYRQISGPSILGKSLAFSGTVTIEEAFAPGTQAVAFIRIFNPDYSHSSIATSVSEGGTFNLEGTIPSTAPIVQFGIETTGPVGAAGRLSASDLTLQEIIEPTAPEQQPFRTGFQQTVIASAGETLRFGLLAANHPTRPLGPGAQGQLRLEFLDANETPLHEVLIPLVTSDSPAHPLAVSRQAIAPAGTAFAKLSVERVTLDSQTDLSGAFLADAAFLQLTHSTALPLVTGRPPSRIVLQSGEPLSLPLTLSSSSPTSVAWYRDGTFLSNGDVLQLTASSSDAGTYYAIAENAAGPVVAAISELMVLNAGMDSDGDSISDADETSLYGTNPLLADSDQDGLSDLEELFFSLTNPNNPASNLSIGPLSVHPNRLDLRFASIPGVPYSLEASADLSSWQPLAIPFTATETETVLAIDFPQPDPSLRFFRVLIAQ